MCARHAGHRVYTANVAKFLIAHDKSVVGVIDHKTIAEGIDGVLKQAGLKARALFALAELDLCLHDIGHVACRAAVTHELTIATEQRFRADTQVPPASIELRGANKI